MQETCDTFDLCSHFWVILKSTHAGDLSQNGHMVPPYRSLTQLACVSYVLHSFCTTPSYPVGMVEGVCLGIREITISVEIARGKQIDTCHFFVCLGEVPLFLSISGLWPLPKVPAC